MSRVVFYVYSEELVSKMCISIQTIDIITDISKTVFVGMVVREAKNSPKITVPELLNLMDSSCSHFKIKK